MTTQINVKIDGKLKKEVEKLAAKLGISVSGLLRAFLLHFVRTRTISFSLDDEAPHDTDSTLDGARLEQELIRAGIPQDSAHKEAAAYDAMLAAEQSGTLISL